MDTIHCPTVRSFHWPLTLHCISSRAFCLLPGSSNKDHIPPSFLDIRTRCNSIPGLTREQVKLCYQATDVTAIALDGLDLAINECQFQVGRSGREEQSHRIPNPNNCYTSLPSHVHVVQFQSYRWNCSSLSKKSRNPHSSTLLKRGK